MALDLDAIVRQHEAAPLLSPIGPELATAIIGDVFRRAAIEPIPDASWRKMWSRPHSLWPEQIEALASYLALTDLRAETIASIAASGVRKPTSRFRRFMSSIKPLTGEMIRANPFRREEFLRKWIDAWGGEVSGETAAESAEAIDRLDYRKALAEFREAERARKSEEKARKAALAAKLAKEQSEAYARGWRE